MICIIKPKEINSIMFKMRVNYNLFKNLKFMDSTFIMKCHRVIEFAGLGGLPVSLPIGRVKNNFWNLSAYAS